MEEIPNDEPIFPCEPIFTPDLCSTRLRRLFANGWDGVSNPVFEQEQLIESLRLPLKGR
jgi:hypothetical protein